MKRISADRPLAPISYDIERGIYVVRHPVKQFLWDSLAIVFGVLFAVITGVGLAFAGFVLIFVNLH